MLAAAADDVRLAEQLGKERALFVARRDALMGSATLMREQRDKVAQQISALLAQVAQASASIGHERKELETNRNLLSEGFISATRISQLEAAVADYGVKLKERRSELARAAQRLRSRPAMPRRPLPPAGSRGVCRVGGKVLRTAWLLLM